jgi:hypothetical protein
MCWAHSKALTLKPALNRIPKVDLKDVRKRGEVTKYLVLQHRYLREGRGQKTTLLPPPSDRPLGPGITRKYTNSVVVRGLPVANCCKTGAESATNEYLIKSRRVGIFQVAGLYITESSWSSPDVLSCGVLGTTLECFRVLCFRGSTTPEDAAMRRVSCSALSCCALGIALTLRLKIPSVRVLTSSSDKSLSCSTARSISVTPATLIGHTAADGCG